MHRSKHAGLSFDTKLIEALMRPQAFSHPVIRIELEETHISWLILTENFVYKIKKPVVFDFLDFSDLEKRKFYCEEEIRLNKPWAPDLYLDVVPVTLQGGEPHFGGNGQAIEYAVRMLRFDEVMQLDRQLETGRLTVTDMRELATTIAARHAGASVVAQEQRTRVIALTSEFMWDNFEALAGYIDSTKLDLLKDWTGRELRKSKSSLLQRFDDGFVRDCHGDLHLANLVRLPDGIATFDCIEFNTDFRQIDVICDIAFLIMDLVERQRHDLAAHFLNRYLEVTGDYGGVGVLNLYFVYRCLVRAKVAVLRSQERAVTVASEDLEEAESYCDMAIRQIADRTPVLIIMHGLSGSGKTFVSGEIMAALPAVRVRSDIERKRMFGIAEQASSDSPVGRGIYTAQASEAVYRRLIDVAKSILASGHNVILDAAFLRQAERAAALSVARDCGCAAVIADVAAPESLLRERIRDRALKNPDASEAGMEVLDHQLATKENLTSAEQALLVECDNSGLFDVATTVDQIKVHCRV
jgi:aminoglycoside phosphotransferase family enzyme/predicted kinase